MGSVSGVRLVTEIDRGRFVLMTGQRVSAPPSVSDEDSLGAEWSMEQPWHQLSSPLLISNLAPLETRVLNQSTNGLHTSLSFSVSGQGFSYHPSPLCSMSEYLDDMISIGEDASSLHGS